jgi:peptidoglycan hydrolase CwlO-like protein
MNWSVYFGLVGALIILIVMVEYMTGHRRPATVRLTDADAKIKAAQEKVAAIHTALKDKRDQVSELHDEADHIHDLHDELAADLQHLNEKLL